MRRRPGRTLWFKHVLLPHVPWQFYPSGRRYRRHAPEPIEGLNSPTGFGVPWLVKVSYQRHLLQLGLADRLLGELLARLRRLGLYRDALVVVVADHGIGFHVDMDRRSVTPRNAEDLAPIPLLVKLPGQRSGSVVDRHVETIDVLPTILELAARACSERDSTGARCSRPVAAQARRVTIFHRVGKRLNTVGGDYSFACRRARAALAARRSGASSPCSEAAAAASRWRSSGSARSPSCWAGAPRVSRVPGERDRRDPSGGAAAARGSGLRLRARRDHRRAAGRTARRGPPDRRSS